MSVFQVLLCTTSDIGIINRMFEKHVIFFIEKSQHDPLLKSPEGIALIKDIFYILKRVCQLIKEQKSSNDTQEEAEDMIDINEIVENEEGGGNSKAANKSAVKNPGIGRGRRKRETTMPEAVIIL